MERTDILVHMLDISWMPDRDPIREYEAINRELALFNPELAGKKQIIVINKIDLPQARENLPKVSKDHGIEYPVTKDPGNMIAKVWHASFYPTIAVIDRKGIVRAIGLKPEAVNPAVEKLLQEPADAK